MEDGLDNKWGTKVWHPHVVSLKQPHCGGGSRTPARETSHLPMVVSWEGRDTGGASEDGTGRILRPTATSSPSSSISPSSSASSALGSFDGEQFEDAPEEMHFIPTAFRHKVMGTKEEDLAVSSLDSSRCCAIPKVGPSLSVAACDGNDQFADAPEKGAILIQPPLSPPPEATNITRAGDSRSCPLQALAIACAAESTSPRTQGPSKPANFSQNSVSTSSTATGSTTSSFQVGDDDVLCGRGGSTTRHPGNVLFRDLVRSKQEAYIRANKRDKAGIAHDIVKTMRAKGGRFLMRDRSSGVWVDIGNKKAREKTSQALREGAPDVRRRLVEEEQKCSRLVNSLLKRELPLRLYPVVLDRVSKVRSLSILFCLLREKPTVCGSK